MARQQLQAPAQLLGMLYHAMCVMQSTSSPLNRPADDVDSIACSFATVDRCAAAAARLAGEHCACVGAAMPGGLR